MDWSLNMPWELGELDPNAEPTNMGSMVGPISRRLDCSVDLRLGGSIDLGLSEKWKEQQRVSMPSSSSKRARVPNYGNQNVSCSVDGCKSDLSNCKRDYHRRHRVCEDHSKTPKVMVGGQEQRFCQQCSRFHLLVEFDEAKRSCRKRLDEHNRRRRKPQPESFNSGALFSDHQGNRFSSYSHLFPASSADPNWPIMVKTEEDTLYSSKRFPFLQESSSNIFGNGLARVLNSDYALSLLSSPQIGQIVTDRVPMGQPLSSYGGVVAANHVSRTGFSCSGMGDEHVGTAVLGLDTNDNDTNCQGVFGSDVGGSQVLHFW